VLELVVLGVLQGLGRVRYGTWKRVVLPGVVAGVWLFAVGDVGRRKTLSAEVRWSRRSGTANDECSSSSSSSQRTSALFSRVRRVLFDGVKKASAICYLRKYVPEPIHPGSLIRLSTNTSEEWVRSVWSVWSR
jgi:hypothetical protein